MSNALPELHPSPACLPGTACRHCRTRDSSAQLNVVPAAYRRTNCTHTEVYVYEGRGHVASGTLVLPGRHRIGKDMQPVTPLHYDMVVCTRTQVYMHANKVPFEATHAWSCRTRWSCRAAQPAPYLPTQPCMLPTVPSTRPMCQHPAQGFSRQSHVRPFQQVAPPQYPPVCTNHRVRTLPLCPAAFTPFIPHVRT